MAFWPNVSFFLPVEYLGASFLMMLSIDWIIQKVVVVHHESHVSYDESCNHRYGGMA